MGGCFAACLLHTTNGPREGLRIVIQVFPRIDNAKLMDLFRKGVAGQWSATEIDWAHPLVLDRHEKRAFAMVLTPIYLGEQMAMLGASTAIPQCFAAHETEAQLYLSTFLLDEARHFETLTRFYNALDQRPLEVRELRDMFRYQARLFKSRDRVEWLWGILLSDILARHFYSILAKAHPDSLFAQIAGRILRDEARHLAFAELYLRAALEREPQRGPVFLQTRDELLRLMESIYAALKTEAVLIGIDGQTLFGAINRDIENKVKRLQLGEEGNSAAI